MRDVFADTSFFVACLNRHDDLHQIAMLHASDRSLHVLTTQWVLVEVANWFAESAARNRIRPYIEVLTRQPHLVIEPATDAQFHEGLEIYSDRSDKGWSLTDCISFSVIRAHRITDVLTADHHFEQAGFQALLRSS